MNQYSAYSLVSMLNGNNNSANTNQSGYPYSNNQPPGFAVPPFYRNSPTQQNYSDKDGPYLDYGNKNRFDFYVYYAQSPIYKYTPINLLIKKLIFCVKDYIIKTSIIKYYSLPNSIVLKLCKQKIWICYSPEMNITFINYWLFIFIHVPYFFYKKKKLLSELLLDITKFKQIFFLHTLKLFKQKHKYITVQK